MIMSMHKQLLENYLRKHSITDKDKMDKIIKGFDLNSPVYLYNLNVGDRVFQYIRRPNSESEVRLGQWFALKGSNMDSLGIFSGGSGRLLNEFEIVYPVQVIEGTAKSLPWDWKEDGIGGSGGATQMFMPSKLFYALRPLGIHFS